MLATVNSLVLLGIEARPVKVEVDIQSGLPAFELSGLASAATREARERVRPAIKNSGFQFPNRRITVNLAPADFKKEGSHFDLPIALAILLASEQLPNPLPDDLFFCGELSLNGELRMVPGILPMAMEMARWEAPARFVVPLPNSSEAGLVHELSSFYAASLVELCSCLKGENTLEPVPLFAPDIHNTAPAPDFDEVKGQESAKRSLLIAAAGMHNVLMIGPPGGGKTMLARRLPGILPEMSREEILETTRVYSIAGLLDQQNPLIQLRPFRSPHRSASMPSIIGGGRIPRPGEISLAQNGVLFLDEFPDFNRDVLEALRQPLEDKVVTVARTQATYTYPAHFSLVASMNPCPCITKVPEGHFKYEVKLAPNTPEETLGQRLRKARLAKKMKQSEVAEKAGVWSHTIKNWENDHTFPTRPYQLKRVADVLGITMEYLLGPLLENAPFGERLAYYRICRGWTQKEMAHQMGVCPEYLRAAEKGKDIPHIRRKSIALDEEHFRQ